MTDKRKLYTQEYLDAAVAAALREAADRAERKCLRKVQHALADSCRDSILALIPDGGKLARVGLAELKGETDE